MTGAGVVSLREVTKRYARSPEGSVFRDVTLAVDPGAVVVVAGANGAGKSALLSVIAGLARPSGGEVIRHHCTRGYAPASNPQLPAMSVRRYLHHMGRVHGVAPRALEPGSRSCATHSTCALGVIRKQGSTAGSPTAEIERRLGAPATTRTAGTIERLVRALT